VFGIQHTRSPREQAVARACAVLGTAALALTTDASANGRFPRADQLVFVPGRPDELVLRVTFGLLVSRDAGVAWDWVCEPAIGFDGIEDPAVAVLNDGVVLAGLFGGLAQSDAGTCSWRFSNTAALDLPVVDLSARRDAPNVAVALAWEAQPPGQNTPGYRSRFFATNDNGASWASYGTPLDPSVLMLTLDLAPSEPRRLYASGIRSGMARSGVLFVSVDEGLTWTEHAVPFDARSEQGLYIAAVDPLDPLLVYLRTSAANTSRLLVTRDGGTTFEEQFAGGPMLGFALSADGAEIFLGGLEDGLWVSPRGPASFLQRSTLPIQCLASRGDTLYACSNDVGGFALGASRDGGRNFEPMLRLSEVRGPLACPDGSSASVCGALWPAMSDRLGITGAAGNELPPAVIDNGVSARAYDGGCALGTVGAREPWARSAGWALLGCCALLLRRLRPRQGS
jgi:photosystem II stability/assembly factor-like uncharacterized protein